MGSKSRKIILSVYFPIYNLNKYALERKTRGNSQWLTFVQSCVSVGTSALIVTPILPRLTLKILFSFVHTDTYKNPPLSRNFYLGIYHIKICNAMQWERERERRGRTDACWSSGRTGLLECLEILVEVANRSLTTFLWVSDERALSGQVVVERTP